MTTEATSVELRAEARQRRREFARTPLNTFAKQMEACMTDYHKARNEGVSREDAILGIEAVLRDAWPRKVSKFQTCVGCDNTGWRLVTCTDTMRCGRKRCAEGHPAYEHTYVVPCECSAGDRFRQREGEKTVELTDVAKTRKKKSTGWTKFGG